MRSISFNFLLVLLAMFIFSNSSIVVADYHVYIINNLDESVILRVHCKSKDNDLGIRNISYGGLVSWKFKINIIRTTLFYCDINWRNVKGHFDVFVAKRDAHRCVDHKWYWRIDLDGLYLFIKDKRDVVLQYKWPWAHYYYYLWITEKCWCSFSTMFLYGIRIKKTLSKILK